MGFEQMVSRQRKTTTDVGGESAEGPFAKAVSDYIATLGTITPEEGVLVTGLKAMGGRLDAKFMSNMYREYRVSFNELLKMRGNKDNTPDPLAALLDGK